MFIVDFLGEISFQSEMRLKKGQVLPDLLLYPYNLQQCTDRLLPIHKRWEEMMI